jgi:hydrogenase maturation protease
MSDRTLVAGIGNVFLGDDGFGVEVVSRLAGRGVPDGVRVVDYGIRGMHLAYDLASGYETAILVDAAPRGEEPGTVYVIEPDLSGPVAAEAPAVTGDSSAAGAASATPDVASAPGPAAPAGTDDAAGVDAALAASPFFDAHGMQPDVVFGMLDMLDGGRPGRILVVGCEPASVDYGMGLSEAVAAAVDEAVRIVLDLVAAAGGQQTDGQNPGSQHDGSQPGHEAVTGTSKGGAGHLLAEGSEHVPRNSR